MSRYPEIIPAGPNVPSSAARSGLRDCLTVVEPLSKYPPPNHFHSERAPQRSVIRELPQIEQWIQARMALT